MTVQIAPVGAGPFEGEWVEVGLATDFNLAPDPGPEPVPLIGTDFSGATTVEFSGTIGPGLSWAERLGLSSQATPTHSILFEFHEQPSWPPIRKRRGLTGKAYRIARRRRRRAYRAWDRAGRPDVPHWLYLPRVAIEPVENSPGAFSVGPVGIPSPSGDSAWWERVDQ